MMKKLLLKVKRLLVKCYVSIKKYIAKEISERRYSKSLLTDYRRAGEFLKQIPTPPSVSVRYVR